MIRLISGQPLYGPSGVVWNSEIDQSHLGMAGQGTLRMNWSNANVAIVFDNTLRPETTGVYCRRAMSELVRDGLLGSVEHLLPQQLSKMDQKQFDLVLFIDDGLDYAIPVFDCPSGFWAIDTHLNFARSLSKSRQATWTFAAQKNGASELQKSGISQVVWLPLACDPLRHGKQDVQPQFDVSFVGNIFPGPRSELIKFVQTNYPRSFVGQKYFEEMAEIYSASRMVFNRSINNDVNMRVFEGLCSGTLLVTDDLATHGLSDLFENGVHLATYRSVEELKETVDYFLAHEDERAAIAAEGRREVLAHHTYRHRMLTMLECISDWLMRSGDLPASNSHRTEPSKSSNSSRTSAAPETIKQPGYFEWARPEILELIPSTARCVLDIGCGAGRLGESLKARQPVVIVGIELDAVAAQQASQLLDQVHVCNIEDPTVKDRRINNWRNYCGTAR